MAFLRFIAHVALSVWIGGLVVLGGIAAPSIFSTLEAGDPAHGRTVAGIVFGSLFGRFQYVAWMCASLMLISLGVRAALGPRPRLFGLRMWITAAMLAISLSTVFFITPRIETLRTSVSGQVADLPDTDARKIAFGRWHGLSNGLMLLTLAMGATLMWTETKDH